MPNPDLKIYPDLTDAIDFCGDEISSEDFEDINIEVQFAYSPLHSRSGPVNKSEAGYPSTSARHAFHHEFRVTNDQGEESFRPFVSPLSLTEELIAHRRDLFPLPATE